MKSFLIVLVITSPGILAQEATGSGSISGVVKGSDGSAIAGANVAVHLKLTYPSRFGTPKTDWTTTTVSGGTFQLTGLASGSYTVCADVPGSTWLDPCRWNLSLPSVTISSASLHATVTITLTRGAALPVRVNDAAQFLPQHQGKAQGAGLLIGISSPGYIFRMLPILSQDSSGRNYQIVVPFNTQFTLVIHPSQYQVNDAAGNALNRSASTKVPIFIGSGQQAPSLVFNISGFAASGGGK